MATMIYKVSNGQKNQLLNKAYRHGMIFNPIQDINDDWIISVEEYNQCNVPPWGWVKNLTPSEYEPKPVEDIP